MQKRVREAWNGYVSQVPMIAMERKVYDHAALDTEMLLPSTVLVCKEPGTKE